MQPTRKRFFTAEKPLVVKNRESPENPVKYDHKERKELNLTYGIHRKAISMLLCAAMVCGIFTPYASVAVMAATDSGSKMTIIAADDVNGALEKGAGGSLEKDGYAVSSTTTSAAVALKLAGNTFVNGDVYLPAGKTVTVAVKGSDQATIGGNLEVATGDSESNVTIFGALTVSGQIDDATGDPTVTIGNGAQVTSGAVSVGGGFAGKLKITGSGTSFAASGGSGSALNAGSVTITGGASVDASSTGGPAIRVTNGAFSVEDGSILKTHCTYGAYVSNGTFTVDPSSAFTSDSSIASVCVVNQKENCLSLANLPAEERIASVTDTNGKTYWSVVSSGSTLGVTNESNDPVTLTGAEKKLTLKPSSILSPITFTPANSQTSGKDFSLTVTLKDQNGNPLIGQHISIRFVSKTYERTWWITTDLDGEAEMKPDVVIPAETYTVTASYGGNDTYGPTAQTATYQVTAASSSNPSGGSDNRSNSGSSSSSGKNGNSVQQSDASTEFGATYISDTTMPLAVNGAYTFKITSLNGKIPVFVVGTPDVFETALVAQNGNDYYYKITAKGNPGANAGIYINGGVRLLVATVNQNFTSDTTGKLPVKEGATYQFKVTTYKEPRFVVGTSGFFHMQYVGRKGNNYYFKITAVGKPGDCAGIYINGSQKPVAVGQIN